MIFSTYDIYFLFDYIQVKQQVHLSKIFNNNTVGSQLKVEQWFWCYYIVSLENIFPDWVMTGVLGLPLLSVQGGKRSIHLAFIKCLLGLHHVPDSV